MFSNIKFIALCALATLLLGLISFFAYNNHSLSKELTKTKEALAECNISIEVQNKAIEQIIVDTEEFEKKMQEESKRIETRYEYITLTSEDSSCDLKLRNIDNALQTFYAR